VVVLLSGGIDSLVCAEIVRHSGNLKGCVFVDYGHPAQIAEGWKAFAYCGSRGIQLRAPHLRDLDLGDMADECEARVVPSRNAMLLSVAANVALSMGADTLVIGCNSNDQEDYPDCRRGFLDAMEVALGMKIAAPLIGMKKDRVIQEAICFGLRREEAWSCYGPGPEPCGECPSCEESDLSWRRSGRWVEANRELVRGRRKKHGADPKLWGVP